MTDILLGPILIEGSTSKVTDKKTGKVYYKKQILPEGKFTYKTPEGKDLELDLTADKIKSYVQAFKDKAYDEVPFQFGAHSNDPTIRKGTLADVEQVPGKGVWGYFELEKDAAEYVEKYPNFGVSPRLVVDLKRMDGKKFAGAIQHVAGTVVPRASGMSPWEKIELSQDEQIDGAQVFDFSDEIIKAHKDGKVGDVTKTTGEGKGETSFSLSQEDYDFFTKLKNEYSEAERLLGETEEKKNSATGTQVDLSEITKKADDALAGLAEMRAQAVKDSWAAKKALLLSQGVPPAALDLATPVMTAVESQTFDLSTDEGTVKITAKDQMLGQLELMKGMVDLSSETGHGLGGSEPNGTSDTAEELDAWMRAQGI